MLQDNTTQNESVLELTKSALGARVKTAIDIHSKTSNYVRQNATTVNSKSRHQARNRNGDAAKPRPQTEQRTRGKDYDIDKMRTSIHEKLQFHISDLLVGK